LALRGSSDTQRNQHPPASSGKQLFAVRATQSYHVMRVATPAT